MNEIKLNIQEIEAEIESACNIVNRPKEDIQLIAVSKTFSVEKMKMAYDAGMRKFGESKVQEFLTKYEEFSSDVEWHFIGHLQSNKVKYIIDKVDVIQSLDSLKLATIIDKEAAKIGKVQRVLIQVNLVEEASKYGFTTKELRTNLQQISQLKNIQVEGLMFIPPFEEDENLTKAYFSSFHELFVDIKQEKYDNITMNILSMGMTHDYNEAIKFGSNMIRVGTGIFGSRQYRN